MRAEEESCELEEQLDSQRPREKAREERGAGRGEEAAKRTEVGGPRKGKEKVKLAKFALRLTRPPIMNAFTVTASTSTYVH
jgi:hypothetical protein